MALLGLDPRISRATHVFLHQSRQSVDGPTLASHDEQVGVVSYQGSLSPTHLSWPGLAGPPTSSFTSRGKALTARRYRGARGRERINAKNANGRK